MAAATTNMQSNKTDESETNALPAYSNADTSQGISEGLYVLVNKKARTLLDLSGGNTGSPATCEGYQRNVNEKIDHQLWVISQVERDGNYRIMSYRAGTFLDLEAGKSEKKSRVMVYNRVEKGDGRLHQEWIISPEVYGYHTIQCAKTKTFLEILDDKPENATHVVCSPEANDKDHQFWELERVSRTVQEVKAMIQSWKPDLLNRLVQPYGDNVQYFVLPNKLRDTIWDGTKLLRQPVRTGTFDYDDFVIKVKDAINTWARDRLRKDGYSVLFGIIYGQDRRGSKAYNWYLSRDMGSLVFLDAQTNREYTTTSLDNLGFEPTFALF
ncbi:carbohydrate-binding module family 13 protein [Tulasnella calospora MUT 4182]|uniref:Carbohydrate-binding module family 13 protein n=1 Tax=Tulasnella calospora MUT 4182 TaxID=1051891 RepID=A0A0C3QCD3_9AGAM|nr:carbohydrate-binding module family 13 protein [Tulasnella calospora MUT 4182]